MDIEPKTKWWTVHRQDVGRELGNPDWVDWAMKELADLRQHIRVCVNQKYERF